ncbi:mechanosensitive ion channel family protein [Paracoccus mutanolyticus]|uniref:mechanosensitive ion channel family protein n=1 Tax=Paracoccus mutanolyticus TaxID=1499308 RepID=UPI00167BC0E1|nr:mechanosensitive ion channel family protein [Paracoccus mutanolyticus]
MIEAAKAIGIPYTPILRPIKSSSMAIRSVYMPALRRPRPPIRHAGDWWGLRNDLLRQIKDSFDDAGVEIPFPTQALIYDNKVTSEREAPA